MLDYVAEDESGLFNLIRCHRQTLRRYRRSISSGVIAIHCAVIGVLACMYATLYSAACHYKILEFNFQLLSATSISLVPRQTQKLCLKLVNSFKFQLSKI